MRINLIAITILAATSTAVSQELSVEEIVQRTNHTSYYQGSDGKARVSMTITDSQGRSREREFTILRRNMDEEDKEQGFYVYFHRPADVREMVFMVWKHVGADDDRWLYLPALDVVKRIAASDERTSFVGSHFYYEDISGRGTEEDEHELLETTDVYYVLKNTPKDPDQVEFDSFTMWIHKPTFVPVKVEYEKGGEVYRIVEALKVDDIQGYKTVTKSRMKDLKSGGETVLEYSTVEYDIGLPEDIFTERYLRRAPRQYLR
ncbi:MAG: outer membrane lipoprotein-sorting protein [Candidatus Hydrogenedentes bacterium]|nr:outer membrane lipoprotein-sorting protein [Candidatus Hydrogenedentota bacterium]